MSVGYQAVGWNGAKRRYDAVLAALIALYLAAFVGLGWRLDAAVTLETLLIRGFGSLAFLLLHLALAIGPLCRLDRRFLPLLYNRRHLGVATFLCGLAHGLLALVQFHALGDRSPLVSLLSANARYDSLAQFPFEALGLAALLILFALAATSHDFWLANLTPRLWKALHLCVYGAYGLLVAHVALGELQSERGLLLTALLGLGAAGLLALHLLAATRERATDRERGPDARAQRDAWVDVGAPDEIPEARAKVVTLAGERVAVFRHAGRISALSNVCRHQLGPLGEGRVIDGCVTCPWHGYQYRPEDGCAPAPFTEKVPTYSVRVHEGRVLVQARAHPPGTRIEPARIEQGGPRARA